MDTLNYNNKSFRLQRFPLRSNEILRAWDSADEYMLEYCLENDLPGEGQQVLIVNDGFGALATALAEYNPISWGDSYLAKQALYHNLELNEIASEQAAFIPSDSMPEEKFDLILLKLPKSMVWWEDILLKLRPNMHAETRIITGGMIKYSPGTAYQLLERCIGSTKTSLGKKKARLAFSTFNLDLECADQGPTHDYQLEDFNLNVRNLPNVFAYSKLDNGTRFLLANMPQKAGPVRAVDLGCGNGVLTMGILKNCPEASVLAVDESYQAVACTRENIEAAGLLDGRDIRYLVDDCLTSEPPGSFDLIVCNPPFHQRQVVGDQVAWRMFTQSRRALDKGGELIIVGNQHLGYHVKLKRLFGNCRIVASDSKFVVLSSKN